ncbi:hypothetical protein [Nocardia asiatica]|uniref:hypothetical protein n=1 Tax=Nocardia asiatica TaxID=209252 RepID=UPI0003038B60|nr:hypothetical protein [Nocardia asiatica]
MTGPVLTPQRRAELAELLGDEARLKAEYPRVAEYLDTAATLSGAGDAEADAAFDSGFVHYISASSTRASIRTRYAGICCMHTRG